MEGEIQSPQRTPNKRTGGLEDSGFLSPGQLDQTPIPLLTRRGGVPQGRRTLDVAPESPANSLKQDGESPEEEEEQLVQGIEPDSPPTQSPAGPSGDKWAWMKDGRVIALISVSVLLAISVAINCWLAVSLYNKSKDNDMKHQIIPETQELQLCASFHPFSMDVSLINGTCYFYSKEKKTWDQSQKFCESHNGTLPNILDQDTLDTIRANKTIDDPWVGLRKRDDVWQWLNGTPFSNSLLPLAQDGPNLHCAYLNEKEYGVLDCKTERNFICTS